MTRAMVVDDTESHRGLFSLVLELEGIEVVDRACSAEAAIGSVGEVQPDLLLLDMVMPGMDGITALPLIRALSPNTRVVMLSCFDEDGLLEEAAYRQGADAVLDKTSSLAVIVGRLREIVLP